MRWFSLAGLLALTACGTDTIFDYSSPKPVIPSGLGRTGTTCTATDTSVECIAQSYANQYGARASTVASSAQIFDVGTILGGVGTIAAVIARSATQGVEYGALGTTGLLTVGNYYATRARSAVYQDGVSSMVCIGLLAEQAHTLFEVQKAKDQLNSMLAALPTTDVADIAAINGLIAFPNHALFSLSSALSSINSKISNRALSASQAPDISSLTTQLLSQAQNAAGLRNQLSGAAKNGAQLANAKQSAPVVDMNLVNPLVEFASSFDTQVTSCIGKAG